MMWPFNRDKAKKSDSNVPINNVPRFIFIGGLHRSGTSPVYKALTRHEDAAYFSDTGVPEDEGQHLQSVYEPALTYGGPGRFAFNERARLTEQSDLATKENRYEIIKQWGKYLNYDKRFCIEKSPPNIIRARFLQALFPDACFVFVVRHPLVVALATRKWSKTSLLELLLHWGVAHHLLLGDIPYLKKSVVIRYEDLVSNYEIEMDRIWQSVGEKAISQAHGLEDRNLEYLRGMSNADKRELDRGRDLIKVDLFEKFGYSIREPYVNPDS